MRDGGDTLALGRNVARAIKKIAADLPVGIEQAGGGSTPDGRSGDQRIHHLPVQAIAIVLVVSFIALGYGPARSWP